MNIGSLVTTTNTQAEESFTTTQILGFSNDAIARINIECNANFPYLDSTGAEYTAFPEKWQRTLLVPFIVGRMKQVDASQFEYSQSFSEFGNSLNLFKTKYTIPDTYKDTDQNTRFDDDFSYNPWHWQLTSDADDPWEV